MLYHFMSYDIVNKDAIQYNTMVVRRVAMSNSECSRFKLHSENGYMLSA